MGSPPRRILPAIIFSQFTGTSLWFAGNAVLPDLQRLWGLSPHALAYMTSSVQLGFIAGTLVFAVLAVSDIFKARKIFLACSLLGAVCNAGVYLFAEGLTSLMGFRFLTGFFLAGIYPVGMKIAADWYHLSRIYRLDELRAIIDGLSCQQINAYLADNPPRDFRIVTLGEHPLEKPLGIS